jgi:hypothetical protein
MHQKFVVLCFLMLSSAPSFKAAAQQRPALSGEWEGAVQIPGYELRVVIDLVQKDQEWVGSLTAPQFGVKGGALSAIAVKENDVEFKFKGAATFKGHLEKNGELKGEYKQGGNSAPFVLNRVSAAHVDFPEFSTAISKDIQGDWKGVVQLPNSTINLILRLPIGGTATTPGGQLVVVDSGNAITMTLWKQEGSRIFALFDSGISYDGEFDKDTAEITGSIRTGPVEVPLSLHRSATNSPASPAAQPEKK